MGCDIHSYIEVRRNGAWEVAKPSEPPGPREDGWRRQPLPLEPLYNRSYKTFAFLAGVRNYDDVQPLSEPRGLPTDVSPELRATWGGGPSEHRSEWEGESAWCHSPSYLTLRELLDFDFDQQFLVNERGELKKRKMTVREYLGPNNELFEAIRYMQGLGGPDDARIVFWFDS